MKKSLLDKVRKAEEEAQATIAAAEEAGKQDVAALQGGEAATLEETRAAAQQKAKAVHDELAAKANTDLNQVKQDQTKATAAITEAAAKNKAATLQLAEQLFNDTCLTKQK